MRWRSRDYEKINVSTWYPSFNALFLPHLLVSVGGLCEFVWVWVDAVCVSVCLCLCMCLGVSVSVWVWVLLHMSMSLCVYSYMGVYLKVNISSLYFIDFLHISGREIFSWEAAATDLFLRVKTQQITTKDHQSIWITFWNTSNFIFHLILSW